MLAAESAGWLVFWVVAVARFLLALTTPRYPLPGILASLVLDAADQTLFQQFTSLELSGYQGYDKALDIFYLAIAYISTLRNWASARCSHGSAVSPNQVSMVTLTKAWLPSAATLPANFHVVI